MACSSVKDLDATLSSLSVSDENFSAEDDEDEEIKNMLSEQIVSCKLVGSLPPTPRPNTRASSVCSIISTPTPTSSPTKKVVQETRSTLVLCDSHNNSNKKVKRGKNVDNFPRKDELTEENIQRMLSEQIVSCGMVRSLPPTPQRSKTRRASSVSSVNSTPTATPTKNVIQEGRPTLVLCNSYNDSPETKKREKDLRKLGKFSSKDVATQDKEIQRMLSEQIVSCDVVRSLPPTPQRPRTRGSSVSSILSSPSPCKNEMRPAPVPCKNFRASKLRKQLENDICKEFGIDKDDPDFEALLDDREEVENISNVKKDDGIFLKPMSKIKVENLINELISDTGVAEHQPNVRSRKAKRRGRQTKTQAKVKKEESKSSKLDSRWTDLKMTADGRCAVLKDDVETVRNTKLAIDSLITVLEKTRERLINDDTDLVYTEPPFRTKRSTRAN